MKKLSLIIITLSLLTFSSCGSKKEIPQKTEFDIFIEQYKEKYPYGYTLNDGFYEIVRQSHVTRNSKLVKNNRHFIYGELSAINCRKDSICAYSSSFRYSELILNEYIESNVNEYVVVDNKYTKKYTECYLEENIYHTKTSLYECDIDYVPMINVNIGDSLIKSYAFDEEKIEESGLFNCIISFKNNKVMCLLDPLISDSYPNTSYNFIYQFSPSLEIESIYCKEIVEYRNGEDIDVYDSSCYIHKSTEEAISLHDGEEFIPTTEFLYEINL